MGKVREPIGKKYTFEYGQLKEVDIVNETEKYITILKGNFRGELYEQKLLKRGYYDSPRELLERLHRDRKQSLVYHQSRVEVLRDEVNMLEGILESGISDEELLKRYRETTGRNE